MARRQASQTQRLLFVGFGGLMLLLAFSGLNALSVLRRIQTQNDTIRRDYFNRDHILEQLRTDIYLSGTHVRDLLLEQDPALAEEHRKELNDTRERINANVGAYEKILRPSEVGPFQEFTKELKAYFISLNPALQWNAAERKRFGYDFMKNSLLPRRMTIVRLADQIGQVNQKQMGVSSRQVNVLFSNFRRWLIALLILTLVCGGALAGGSMYRIMRLDRLSTRRFEEVEQARGALRDLSTRLIAVQESERRALSRELHDEVGQSLSALLLGLGNVAALLRDSNEEARAQLQDLRRLAERTVAVVRDMSLLLRPSMLDDLGLIPAVQWQAREVSRTKNLRVQVQADSISEDLSDEQRTCIYRVVQEALHNITRHAKAKSVRIQLQQEKDRLLLTIEDDGQGFMPAREKGVGLLGMEERVTHLHGSFRVDSAPGKGTSIRVELPVSEKRQAVLT